MSGASSLGEVVEVLIGNGGPIVIGLSLLNQAGFLSHDVHGERQFADLSDEVFREGGILFLFSFEWAREASSTSFSKRMALKSVCETTRKSG